jgi:hypothetical protein
MPLKMAVGLALLAWPLRAQMTISGRVTVGDEPARGASVRIADVGVSTRTAADGRYNVLIRALAVRGQTVEIVARYRSATQTARVVLAGGSIEQDFRFEAGPPAGSDSARDESVALLMAAASRAIDSSAFEGVAGPLDLAGALAGRIPGLLVTGATSAGSSSLLVFRGARSVTGNLQPLVVVDGVALENESFANASQRFGLGGFDYGTPVQQLALANIASLRLLSAAEATPLYGSRAANGVLIVATRKGGREHALSISADQRFSMETPTRLPSYQNRFGQGLGGQFEFFDGRGGGINDSVAQSWGPALDGRPLAQASLTEAGRPDVRFWLPQPADTRRYFGTGETIDVNAALAASRGRAEGRAAVDARRVTGLTPGSTLLRLGLLLTGTARPSARLSSGATVHLIRSRADDRPGTGFDEINPVAGFTQMGRQVDLDGLRQNISDGTDQINWIYTARNNPFFQTERNANGDTRFQAIGGAHTRYDFGRGLSAGLELALNGSREDRDITVASGWKGGYPTTLGRRSFSGGGSEQREVDFTERLLRFTVQSVGRSVQGFALASNAGIENRSSRFRTNATVTDTTVVTGRGSSQTDVSALFVTSSLSRKDMLFLDAGARVEGSSTFPSGLGFAVFPSVSVGYDIARAVPAVSTIVGTARVRASWWLAGNEVSARTLQETYAGGGSTGDPAIGTGDSTALPERTRGVELATEIASRHGRVALDLTIYDEKSRELLAAVPGLAGQTAELSNRGIEAQLRLSPLRAGIGGVQWDIAASVARNRNRVNQLAAGIDEIALGPSIWGASLVARRGEPTGVITGRRYLRDSSTKALMLKNGLPIPDQSATAVLGSVHPDWTASLTNSFRIGGAEIEFLLDGRMGGRMFSATNLWGSYAGTLESTVQDRDAGVTLAGIDSTTGAPNTITRSAEDYFHSLGAIHEAWVYDASYWRLRETRMTYVVPLNFVPGLREYTVRATLVGRNLLTSTQTPNFDPESVLSPGAFQGFEMGQLPTTKSIGIRLRISP